MNKKNILIAVLFFGLILFSQSLFSDDDDSESSKPASDVAITNLGGGKYKLVAKGKASGDAIESGMKIKMQATSCEVAKLKIKTELKNLLPDESNPFNFAYEDKKEFFENNLYCELTYIYDKNSTRNLKK